MIPNWALALVLPLFALGMVALWWWQKRKAAPPSHWVSIGVEPPGVSEALKVLHALLPGLHWGGWIQWEAHPWKVGFGQSYAAGEVTDFIGQRIRLLYFDRIEDTALAHELKHLANKSAGEDEAFHAWVAEANRQIAKAMGR